MDEITDGVLRVVRKTIGRTDITPESDLLGSGIIDSFDIINLIDAIEVAFDMTIPAEAIVPENFGNVTDMVRLVRTHLTP